MPKNKYELTYVINGVLNDDQIRGLVNRVSKFIDENDGHIIETDEWGTKRLAYQIRKKRNGYYVNVYFEAEGELIARLERALTLEDDILRFLTLKMDSKMLAHYHEQKESARKSAQEAADVAAKKAAEEEAEEEDDEDEDDYDDDEDDDE